MSSTPTVLEVIWFALIGILWAGFFVLEGFDFGVGVMVKALGRDKVERRMIIHSIGPVWDGNEVWLLTAGGATFAAFPLWYASAFSGFYLALFLVLVCLILRGVSFEFWGKVDSDKWRNIWEWVTTLASGGAALLFGVAWANFIHGVPMDAHHIVHATLFDLLNPYALLGGLVTLSWFVGHGAGFLTLRVSGDLQKRADAFAKTLVPVALGLLTAFVVWTMIDQSFSWIVVLFGILTVAAGAAAMLLRSRSQMQAFLASCGTIVVLTGLYFSALYPNALPSTTSPRFDLSLATAASHSYTLVVMTVVAVLMVPIVLAYTAWAYWLMRHRLGRDDYEGSFTPVAVIEHKLGSGSAATSGTTAP